MTNNAQLAQIVADRLGARLSDILGDHIAEITQELLEEEGYDIEENDEETFDTLMDVASRIYIGAA
jgi:hypothetical protein